MLRQGTAVSAGREQQGGIPRPHLAEACTFKKAIVFPSLTESLLLYTGALELSPSRGSSGPAPSHLQQSVLLILALLVALRGSGTHHYPF